MSMIVRNDYDWSSEITKCVKDSKDNVEIEANLKDLRHRLEINILYKGNRRAGNEYLISEGEILAMIRIDLEIAKARKDNVAAGTRQQLIQFLMNME